MEKQEISTLSKDVICNLTVALNHIENVYANINYLLKNETCLNDENRERLYNYGLDKAKMDIIRIVNMRKSLKSIMENKKIVD